MYWANFDFSACFFLFFFLLFFFSLVAFKYLFSLLLCLLPALVSYRNQKSSIHTLAQTHCIGMERKRWGRTTRRQYQTSALASSYGKDGKGKARGGTAIWLSSLYVPHSRSISRLLSFVCFFLAALD